jgi:hypothetical protein
VLQGDVTAGLRLMLNEAKGVPARFVFVKPATAARDDERRMASLPSPQQWVDPNQCRVRSGEFLATEPQTNHTPYRKLLDVCKPHRRYRSTV